MPDIAIVGHGSVGPLNRRGPSHQEEPRAAARPATSTRSGIGHTDSVQLSDHARFLNRLREMPAVRSEHVDRVRAEIDHGTYLTEDKMQTALERLQNDLDT